MFNDFKSLNNEQRKYISGLLGIACIAWASPIYNFLLNLHLHQAKLSFEYIMLLVTSLILAISFFVGGFSVLKGVK